MSIRTPEAILCAHCKRETVAHTCVGCQLQICDICAAAWWTCDRPIAREFKLGIWKRLDDVDPTGRLGIVSSVMGISTRLFDLAGIRYVDGVGVSSGVLRADGDVLSTGTSSLERVDGGWSTLFGLRLTDEHEGAIMMHVNPPVVRVLMRHQLGLPYPDHVHIAPPGAESFDRQRRYRVSPRVSDTGLCVVDADTGTLRFVELPRQRVLTAVDYDPDEGILVAGSWESLLVFIERDGEFHQARRVHIPGADVNWIATANRRVAALIKRNRSEFLTGVMIDRDGGHGLPAEQSIPKPGLAGRLRSLIALRPDGSQVAMALGSREVALCGFEGERAIRFDGHTDSIRLVAFRDSGALMLTADDDSRVIVRPASGAGYASNRVTVSLADPVAHIELAIGHSNLSTC